MFKIFSDAVDGGDELYGCDEGEMLACGEVAADGSEEMRGVDLDVDEDVEGFDGGLVYGDEAGVAVVHEEVAV